MTVKKYILLILTSIVILSSCKTQYDALMATGSVDDKFKAAFELFDAEKYLKAADMFESLSMQTSGTAKDDTVQFYWGYSNYKYGDYLTAEENLNSFISLYPVSPFTEQAKFLRIDCLFQSTYRYELDQTPTYKALNAIEEFTKDNPDSEYMEQVLSMQRQLKDRLELKAYKSAYLYYHMEDYMAAHYALKNVLKDNAENQYREEILFYIAMSSYQYAFNSIPSKQKERYLTFVDDYYNFVSEYPESGMRKDIDPLYDKVQKLKIINSEDE